MTSYECLKKYYLINLPLGDLDAEFVLVLKIIHIRNSDDTVSDELFYDTGWPFIHILYLTNAQCKSLYIKDSTHIYK